MRTAWAQVPSINLCVVQCRAACCRAPGSIVVTKAEAERMGRHASGTLTFYQEGRNAHRLNFSDHGGQCPMLGIDARCRIYRERPDACRAYPMQPEPRCAVWPLHDPVRA